MKFRICFLLLPLLVAGGCGTSPEHCHGCLASGRDAGDDVSPEPGAGGSTPANGGRGMPMGTGGSGGSAGAAGGAGGRATGGASVGGGGAAAGGRASGGAAAG